MAGVSVATAVAAGLGSSALTGVTIMPGIRTAPASRNRTTSSPAVRLPA